MKNLLRLLPVILGMVALGSCNVEPNTSAATIHNLNRGIACEISCGIKYTAFATKAREEHLNAIARLFDALSKSKEILASNQITVLESMGASATAVHPSFRVRSTRWNLESALKEESDESSVIYPDFIKTAINDKLNDVVQSFIWAMDSQKNCKIYYEMALSALRSNTLQKLPEVYYVCPECGYISVISFKNKSCPYCFTRGNQFWAVND